MINPKNINAELNFLAAQSQTEPPIKIQKLSPPQMAAVASTSGPQT